MNKNIQDTEKIYTKYKCASVAILMEMNDLINFTCHDSVRALQD